MTENVKLPELPEPAINQAHAAANAFAYGYHRDQMTAYARQAVTEAVAAERARAERDEAERDAARAELAKVRAAGALLSNIAYNLAQDDRLSDSTRYYLDDARKRWDAALNPKE